MSTCAEVAQRLNYWPPNRTDEGSSPGVSFSFFFFFFFFFFFNIHTSDKLEIFFDHSILVNGVDPWGVHRFLGGINHENGIYSMGQRHECGLGYIIITIYEVVYKIECASECFLAPRYTRFIAFTSKNGMSVCKTISTLTFKTELHECVVPENIRSIPTRIPRRKGIS